MTHTYSKNGTCPASYVSQRSGGYIALTATIIVAIVLLTLVVSVSSAGFYGRFVVFDAETKEVSRALAEGCVETAKLKHAQDNDYDPGVTGVDTVSIGDFECTILDVEDSGNITIEAQAEVRSAYTNLCVEFDSDYDVVSWIEVPNFGGSACI